MNTYFKEMNVYIEGINTYIKEMTFYIQSNQHLH